MKKVKIKIRKNSNKNKNNENGKKEKNQLTESSGLLPLTSNPGAGAFDRGFSVSLSL
jgi:hypothetical protein